MANYTGVTPVIGGTEIFGGSAFTTTAAVVGAAVGMSVTVTPRTFPGNGIYWEGYVSAPNVVTVKVGAAITLFVEASIYDVLVDDGAAAGTVTAVTATAPITSTGGTTPNIAVTKATNAALGVVQVDGVTITASGSGVISAVAGGAGTVTSVLGTAPIVSDGNVVTPTLSITDATNAAKGAVQVDGTTITAAAGVISAAAGASPAVTAVSGTAPIVSSGGLTPAISVTAGTNAAKGVVQVDGTTITAAAGVISAAAGASPAVTAVSGTAPIVSSGGLTPAISVTDATNAAKGVVQVDGTTITAVAGVISATGGISLTAPVQANWTAFNTAGMVQAPTYASSRFEWATNSAATANIQGVAIAVPAAPYSKVFRVWPFISNKSYSRGGVGWADGVVGTPGKLFVPGFESNDPAGLGGGSNNGLPPITSVSKYNSVTSANGVVALSNGFNNNCQVPGGAPVWMRLADNSTNWTWDISFDGVNWVNVLTIARNTFLTATQFVVYGDTGFSSTSVKMVFDSYA